MECISCPLCYIVYYLSDTTVNKQEEALGSANLIHDRLELKSENNILVVMLLDIVDIELINYRILLKLADKTRIELYDLGFKFEMFSTSLFRFRNEALIKALLMEEKLIGILPEALFSYSCNALDIPWVRFSGKKSKTREEFELLVEGDCQIRLYETAMVVVPDCGNLLRLPYSFIKTIDYHDYRLIIESDPGEIFVFKQLGFNFYPFILDLNKACQNIKEKTREMLIEIFPGSEKSHVTQLTELMPDGKAVFLEDMERLSLNICESKEIRENYEYITGFQREENESKLVRIGIKRGLMGDLTKNYVWFMIPLLYFNLIVFEAAETSDMAGGKATYFFRLDSETVEDIKKQLILMNYCMLAINFRREPIYLSQEQLNSEKYKSYRYAVDHIPQLKWLRAHYLGRVFHSDKWKENIREYIERGN